jgi:hypothetical protein
MSSGERAGAALGAVLLAAVGVLTAVRVADSETTAYAVGAAVGQIAVSLLIAYGLRWLYVRYREEGEARSPWVLVLAALIAMVLSIAQGVEDDEESAAESTQSYVAAAEDCKAGEPDPFAGLPAGLTLAELGGRARASLEQELAAGTAGELPPDLILAKRVEQGGRPAGFLLAFPGVAELDREEFLAGFESGAAAAGELEHVDIAGQEAIMSSIPGGAVVAGFSGCYGMIVAAQGQGSAVELAEALLGA